MSASAKTREGFLPPISRASFLYIGAAVAAILAPVAEPPVKEIVLTRGWETIASPVLPGPWTMLKTPGGKSTSAAKRDRYHAVDGVNSDGLATTVQPTARAGATFQVKRYRGKFHGEMQPATPRGWCRV